MKEKILQAFKELGFEMEELDEIGFTFHYEGNRYLYMYQEDDEDFLVIGSVGLHDVGEEAMDSLYELIDQINRAMKYVKACRHNNDLWVSYERELFGGEDLKQVLSSMIIHLDAAHGYIAHVFKDDEDNNDGEDQQ